MSHIWKNLKRPIIALAPMHGATDTVFRQIVASIGKPDLMFTEFLCVDQIYSPDSKMTAQMLEYTEIERPLVAQIWGTQPELFYAAAQVLVEFGFDGIDINMGCPEKSAVKQGACSALIKNPTQASEIIQATVEGSGGKLPVSVKTRIGFEKIATEDWIGFLLSQPIEALTVHGRTAKEMSRVPCHWDEIGKAVSLRNQMNISIPMLGNGDVESLAEAHQKIEIYGLDGIMIGRGVFHDPWVFHPTKTLSSSTVIERISLMERHIRLYEETWGPHKNYAELKRFYKIYVTAFDGASHLRDLLMQTRSYQEAYDVINDWKSKTQES